MADEFELKISYILGIASIILAFVTPIVGLVAGIIGFIKSKGEKKELGKKAKKFNLTGIILSAVILIITVIATVYSAIYGLNGLSDLAVG